ncbi:hypothetical protein SAY86_003297, partial [Trapa natans]
MEEVMVDTVVEATATVEAMVTAEAMEATVMVVAAMEDMAMGSQATAVTPATVQRRLTVPART